MSASVPPLTILELPDKRLHIKAKPIKEVDGYIRNVAQAMLKLMYESVGIGLAATQVNIHKRLIVVDVSDNHSEPRILINPKIEVLDPELVSYREACLSVPGFDDEVRRFKRIRVSFLDEQAAQQSLEADGLLGVCIQHECDHLQGKLFIDHLSNLKRRRIYKKLEKQQKLQKTADYA